MARERFELIRRFAPLVLSALQLSQLLCHFADARGAARFMRFPPIERSCDFRPLKEQQRAAAIAFSERIREHAERFPGDNIASVRCRAHSSFLFWKAMANA